MQLQATSGTLAVAWENAPRDRRESDGSNWDLPEFTKVFFSMYVDVYKYIEMNISGKMKPGVRTSRGRPAPRPTFPTFPTFPPYLLIINYLINYR